MLKAFLERLRQGHRTMRFPDGVALPPSFRGRPVLDAGKCVEGCAACAERCPTDAIRADGGLAIDLGRCLFCPECEEAVKCKKCSVPMTLHRRGKGGAQVCHYCGNTARPPEVCPSCQMSELIALGAGTQKIEEEIALLWPKARALRLVTFQVLTYTPGGV